MIAGAATTVTVAIELADPVALVATSVYVAVLAGETICDPFAATALPFSVTDAAFDVDHESIEDCPA